MKSASRVRLRGSLRPPGDKSIAHRMALLSALARGKSVIENYSPGEDCRRTLQLLRALGTRIADRGNRLEVTGRGYFGFEAPSVVLDAGNSGSTARMVCGLLAGQSFDSRLTGDDSLRRRPMRRVIDPLERMGARIETEGNRDHMPLTIRGGRSLSSIDYELPVPSAQVKTAILLAGLHAEGETRVRERLQSRNHTELALLRFGAEIRTETGATMIRGRAALEPAEVKIPGDISSAAFFITAAAITPGSELTVHDVGLNPTRTGFIGVLQSMGARIDLEVEDGADSTGAEPSGSVRVHGSELVGTEVPAHVVPTLIDEIPVLAVAAARARGDTIFRGVSELRHKESDRLQGIIDGLRDLGARAKALPDGLRIQGGHPLHGTSLRSDGDHRMAMSWAVASVVADGACVISGRDAVSVSYPGFWDDWNRLVS